MSSPSPKKIVVAALAALSLYSCTEEPNPPKPVTPSKVVVVKTEPVMVRDAGAPLTVVTPPKEEIPADPLVLAHDDKNVDHLGRAKSLSGDGDVKGALIEARRALFSNPADVETLTVVARLSRRAGHPEFSAEAWGRIATIQDTDATPLIQQARALVALKDYSGAVMAGREAIARDPGNAEAFQVTGIAQLAMNELSGAIASFEKAVEIEPNHGWAQNNLGFAALRANQNDKAVKALEKAAELLPNVAYVHNNLGVALERTGRKEEAKTAYQQAMDLSPKYVKARINVARMAKVTPEQPDKALGGDGVGEQYGDDESMSDVPHPMPEQ